LIYNKHKFIKEIATMSYFQSTENIQSLYNKAQDDLQKAKQMFCDADDEIVCYTNYEDLSKKDMLENARQQAINAKKVLLTLQKKLKKCKNLDNAKNLKSQVNKSLKLAKNVINSIENTDYYDIHCCDCGIKFLKFKNFT